MQPAIVTKFSREIQRRILMCVLRSELYKDQFWFERLLMYAQSCTGLRESTYEDVLEMISKRKQVLWMIVDSKKGNRIKETRVRIEKACESKESDTKKVLKHLKAEYVITAQISFRVFGEFVQRDGGMVG